jgi:2-alkyl-3-oxoalkanoate reductase
MTILVTGSTGFLGSRLVEHLCASGATHVRCFTRPTSVTTALDELQDRYPSTSVNYLVGNLLSQHDANRATEGIDTVYHLAAQVRGTAPAVFANTVVASRNLLEAIVRNGVRRVVLVSSISVYWLARLHRNALVTEGYPLDPTPERRDNYTFAKIRQESLFQQYRRNHPFELVILRPGALYGEGRVTPPSRAGLRIGPVFLQIASHDWLPVSYVANCASALVLAGSGELPEGSYNVIDDDLPTGDEYIRSSRYQSQNVPCLRLSASAAMLFSCLLDKYRKYSKGQIPPVLTPYQVRSAWAGHVFSNRKLKNAGWRPLVSTTEAMLRTFAQPRDPRPVPAIPAEFWPRPTSSLVKSEN